MEVGIRVRVIGKALFAGEFTRLRHATPRHEILPLAAARQTLEQPLGTSATGDVRKAFVCVEGHK